MTVLCRSNESVVALVNVSHSGVVSDALLVQYGIYPPLMTYDSFSPASIYRRSGRTSTIQ